MTSIMNESEKLHTLRNQMMTLFTLWLWVFCSTLSPKNFLRTLR